MALDSVSRAFADLNAGTIVAHVHIAATPARVFQALSTDEAMTWWGSDASYRTKKWTADLREGGAWRAEGVRADGGPFSVYGNYVEIDAPRKLVLTWKHDWDDSPMTTVAYLIEAVDGGTKLTVHHSGFGANRASCEDHARGWETVLRWLHDYLSSTNQ